MPNYVPLRPLSYPNCRDAACRVSWREVEEVVGRGDGAKRLEREGWSRRAAALRAAALRPIQQPQNKENQQDRCMRKVFLIIFSYYVKKNA